MLIVTGPCRVSAAFADVMLALGGCAIAIFLATVYLDEIATSIRFMVRFLDPRTQFTRIRPWWSTHRAASLNRRVTLL
jgi:hypothetical protein